MVGDAKIRPTGDPQPYKSSTVELPVPSLVAQVVMNDFGNFQFSSSSSSRRYRSISSASIFSCSAFAVCGLSLATWRARAICASIDMIRGWTLRNFDSTGTRLMTIRRIRDWRSAISFRVRSISASSSLAILSGTISFIKRLGYNCQIGSPLIARRMRSVACTRFHSPRLKITFPFQRACFPLPERCVFGILRPH
jgi:hypothetical protein